MLFYAATAATQFFCAKARNQWTLVALCMCSTLVKTSQYAGSSQGEGYFLATASADPIHYRAWDSKQPQMKRLYSVPWSMEELQALIKLNCDTVNISEEQLGKRYAVVGGVPRLILNTGTARLLAVVRERARSITIVRVRVITDWW